MIRNRLAVLLAERELKISKVSEDTRIARSTLTAISQNDSKMIQLETINELCKYLQITPAEFFEYSPIDIEYLPQANSKNNSFNMSIKLMTKEATNITTYEIQALLPDLSKEVEYKSLNADVVIVLYFEGEYGVEEFMYRVYDRLAIGFKTGVNDNLSGLVKEAYIKYLDENVEVFEKFAKDSIRVCLKSNFDTSFFNITRKKEK